MCFFFSISFFYTDTCISSKITEVKLSSSQLWQHPGGGRTVLVIAFCLFLSIKTNCCFSIIEMLSQGYDKAKAVFTDIDSHYG